MRDRLSRFLHRAQVDRAVYYSLLRSVLRVPAGVVSAACIAFLFSEATQGYHYTFSSIVAMNTFVELGLYIVIINVSSHEWSKLSLDEAGRVSGDPHARARLASLVGLVQKWYTLASLAFVAGVGGIGYVILASDSDPDVTWRLQWAVMVILSGAIMWVLPLVSLLEGCGQVASVNRARVWQVPLSALALLVVAWLGGGLWASTAAVAVMLVVDLDLVFRQYGRFFSSLRDHAGAIGSHIDWRSEIWPMQWRLGLSGMVSYFTLYVFVPVMFAYGGAEIAGKVGMTLQVLSVISALGNAWLQPKVPEYGVLAARQSWDELDRLFRSNAGLSVGVVFVGVVSLVLYVYAAPNLDLPVLSHIASRLVGPTTAAVLGVSFVVNQASRNWSGYLRAHKQEPILVASVTGAALTGALIWWWASAYGALGGAWGRTVGECVSAIWIYFVFSRCRREWHR